MVCITSTSSDATAYAFAPFLRHTSIELHIRASTVHTDYLRLYEWVKCVTYIVVSPQQTGAKNLFRSPLRFILRSSYQMRSWIQWVHRFQFDLAQFLIKLNGNFLNSRWLNLTLNVSQIDENKNSHRIVLQSRLTGSLNGKVLAIRWSNGFDDVNQLHCVVQWTKQYLRTS